MKVSPGIVDEESPNYTHQPTGASAAGVVGVNAFAIAIAMGVRKLLWIVNVFYAVIILWNIIMIVALTTKR